MLMQNEGYGNLQGKVGLVYGSFSIFTMVWVLFFLPELKPRRSLDEIDELFNARISVWRFTRFKTKG